MSARVCPQCGRETDAARCPADGLVTIARSLLVESDVADPWIGRVLDGRVQIEAPIGRGGMGAVYRARHLETGGLVAVKVLHPGGAGRAQALRRFHLEAQNAAMLQSVHTIRVSDFGIAEGSPYLVMEYLEGLPLSSIMRRDGALPWRRSAHITAQVCKSLWEAHEHSRRIVHRDIKPGNVFLLDQRGAKDFVKVLDFGISRALDGAGADTRGPIGTPHAMAPEQWRGGEIDGRADLYAVGCLLYEMVAGRPPFDVSPDVTPVAQVAELARQHTHEAVPPLPAEIDAETPPALVRLIRALLAKSPADRPASAALVVERLEALLTQETGVKKEDFGRTVSQRRRSDVDRLAAGGESDGLIDVARVGPPPRLRVQSGGIANDEQSTIDDVGLEGGGGGDDDSWAVPTDRHLQPGQAGQGSANDGKGGPSDPVGRLPSTDRANPGAATPWPAGATGQGMTPSHLEAPGEASPATYRRWRIAAMAFGATVAVGVTLAVWLMPRDEASLRAVLGDSSASRSDRQAAIGELLDRQSTVRLRGLHLRDVDLSNRALREADLQGADLGGVDFQRADLGRADLRRASLARANLRGCNLRGADLRGADLEGAVLAESELQGSRYDGETQWPKGFDATTSGAVGPGARPGIVDLRGADLRKASLADANLQGGKLSDANLGGGNLRGINARDADLSKASLRDADLRGADLRGVDLRGADLRGAQLEGADLRGARYDVDTHWPETFPWRGSGAVGPEAILRREDLSGKDLRGVDLRGADVREARLIGTDLRGARLDAARFDGARYDSATKWPEGFDAADSGAVAIDSQGQAQGGGIARGAAGVAASPAAPPAIVVPAPVDAVPGARPPPGAAPGSTRPIPSPSRPALAPAPMAPAPAMPAPAVPAPAPTPPPQALAAAAVPAVAAPGLRPPPAPHPQLGYEGADLRGCDASALRLQGQSLRNARYDATTRWPAGFDPKRSGALGPGAVLRGADLRRARLTAIDLRGADLRGADLRGASFDGARLQRARLDDARLEGADLRGASLEGCTMTNARYDGSTRWPDAFDAAEAGATPDL